MGHFSLEISLNDGSLLAGIQHTYCARRGTRIKIATLYELLAQAGVQTFKIG